MTDAELVTIPAGRGAAARLRAGQHVRVINTHGTQCVDTWAFVADDVSEFLSMEHSRSNLEKIHFETGDVLATNRYAPLLEIVADTSPGGHDTLIAACSEEMYTRAGRPAGHANCADNLRAARIDHTDVLAGAQPRRRAAARRDGDEVCVGHGHLTSGGRDIRIASVLPPVSRPKRVPRSYSKLNST